LKVLAFRMALRELLRVRGRLGLLAIILAMQIMAVGGAYVMTQSFTASRDDYYRTLRFADLSVGFVPAADNEMPALESLRAIPGVTAVSRRFLTRGTIEDAAGNGTPWPVTVIYLDPGPQDVNDIVVMQGKGLDPAQPSGAIIDSGFAEDRHVSLGSQVVVNPQRFATRFTVAGVGMSPEYLTPPVDPRFSLPARGSMGVIYAPRAKLDELFVDHLYNELLFRIAPGADEKTVREAIVKVLSKLEIEAIVPRRSTFEYRMGEQLLRTPRVLAPILAFVVGSLGAIVAYVLMMRIVEGQRREIGALLAVGFPSWQLVVAYLLVGLVPSLVGAACGMGLAPLFGRLIANQQSHIIGAPEPAIIIPWAALTSSAAFAVVVTLVGVIVPLTQVLRMSPAVAMRGGREVLFGGLPPRLEALVVRLRPTTRYAVRNVMRRARLSAAVVLLLGAGIAAPAALLSVNSSWVKWSERVSTTIRWDAMVNFRVPLAHEHLVSLISTPGLREAETFVQGRSTLSREGVAPQEVRVRGLAVPCHLDARELSGGRDLSSGDALEIVLNEDLARDERPIHVGDKIRLTSPRGRVTDLEVVGLVHDASASTVYVPVRTAQRLLDLGEKVTGMYVVYGAMSERAAPSPVLPEAGARPEGAEVIDFGDAGAASEATPEATPATPETALLREEMVLGMQSRAAAVATTQRHVREERATILPYLIVGMCFALAAVLSVLAILFLERDTEYATLRSMGHGRGRIARIVFTELLALSILGVGAAVATWLALAAYVVDAVSRALFPLPLAYRLDDLLTVAVPTLAAVTLAALVGVRMVQRLDLRATLAARTIG
jgi:putative ABC transport system permease protein